MTSVLGIIGGLIDGSRREGSLNTGVGSFHISKNRDGSSSLLNAFFIRLFVFLLSTLLWARY